jgi:hypothetical protein
LHDSLRGGIAFPRQSNGTRKGSFDMIVPLLFFLVIIFLFRSELGFKGILISTVLTLGAAIACILLNQLLWFTVVLAVIDVVLVVILFGDVRSY